MTDVLGPMTAANSVTARPPDTRTPGATDTFFKPCSSPILRDGTTVEANWLNQVTATLRALARAPGLKLDLVTKVLAEDNTNDAILAQAVLHLIQRGRPNFAVFTGSVNALTATLVPAPAEMIGGLEFSGLSIGANTSATVNVTIGGTAFPVVRGDGSALQIGDIAAAPFYPRFSYDAASGKLLLQNPNARLGAPPPVLLLSLSSSMALSNNVAAAVNTLSGTSNAIFTVASSSVTIVTGGLYSIIGSATSSLTVSGAAGGSLTVNMWKNGVAMPAPIGNVQGFQAGASTSGYAASCGWQLQLAAGDVLTFAVTAAASSNFSSASLTGFPLTLAKVS